MKIQQQEEKRREQEKINYYNDGSEKPSEVDKLFIRSSTVEEITERVRKSMEKIINQFDRY